MIHFFLLVEPDPVLQLLYYIYMLWHAVVFAMVVTGEMVFAMCGNARTIERRLKLDTSLP